MAAVNPFSSSGEVSISPSTIISIIVVVVVSYAIGWGLAKLVKKLWLAPKNVELSTELMVTRVIKYTVLVVGSLIAISEIGLDITPLVMGLGIVGLAIAFGVQEIVANLVSGLIIMVDRPIRVGDIVEVEGATGKVMDVGLRASTVRTPDNINHLIPNKLIILNRITNYSKYDPKIRLQIPVGVEYGSDNEKVKDVLLSIARDHPNVLEDPAPGVGLREFGSSSVDFVLYAWINDPARRAVIREEINWEIDRRFRENGITIPFPQVDVWMRKQG